MTNLGMRLLLTRRKNERKAKWMIGGIIAAILLAIGLVGACVYGWVLNILALAHMTDIATGEGVLRIVGIFLVPIGIIMGWFV